MLHTNGISHGLRTHGNLKTAKSQYLRHKRAGFLASLLFYLHSTQLGYAYLFFLSIVYFANVVLGFCNPETMGIKKRWFYTKLDPDSCLVVCFIGHSHWLPCLYRIYL